MERNQEYRLEARAAGYGVVHACNPPDLFFLIDADKFYLKDIVDVCNESGLQVQRLYSEPFASASVTVPDAYKQLGVALADIGGGTTDGIVFKGGRPVGAFTVNVAGKLMTSDLAIGLSISPEEAEKIKIRFGIKPRPGDTAEVLDIRNQPKTVGPATLPVSEVAQPAVTLDVVSGNSTRPVSMATI